MVVSSRKPSSNDPARFLPVWPNWSSHFREAYEFKTDIITTFDGKEQRRAVRYNPRREIEFTGNAWGEDKLQIDYFMHGWQPKPTWLPDYTRFVTSTVGMAPEASGAGVSGDTSWIKPGMTLALANDGLIESRTVLSVSSTSVGFSDSSDTPFPAGTKFCAVHKGQMQVAPKVDRLTSNIATLGVRFNVDPGSFDYEAAPGITYSGWREAFLKKPDWKGGVSVEHIWPREPVDYGYGKTAQFIPYDFPARISRMDFIGRDRADVKAAVDFFHRHRGRWREFVVPTWENDIPYQFISSGSKAILIPGQVFGQVYQDSSVFKRIILRMSDGTFHHRMVDFVEVLEETDSSVLWTVEDLPLVTLSPATMFGISWGLVSRFATDRLEIDWLTDSVAQFSMSFQSLENFDI